MKFTRKLIPAFAMLLLSAVLMSTASFAWFSVNTQVTAQGMNVKAKAEAGLSIASAPAGTYGIDANSATATTAELKPGSTSDLANWYHSTSTSTSKPNTGAAYEAATEGTHYVKHSFYIRSTAAEALNFTSLDVKSVTATGALQALSKALRVGIKVTGADKTYIYAPVAGATTGYTVHGDVAVTALAGTAESKTSVNSVPANTENGLVVEVYIWFEGEDAACVSNNIVADLETIAVSVVFGYTA